MNLVSTKKSQSNANRINLLPREHGRRAVHQACTRANGSAGHFGMGSRHGIVLWNGVLPPGNSNLLFGKTKPAAPFVTGETRKVEWHHMRGVGC